MTYRIKFSNVFVNYRIPSEKIGTFKEYMIKMVQGKIHHRTFAALQNINLEINHGEVFGLIGRNGAGKSTMLKIIARVLTPSSGRIEVNGNVSPMLELGAGFHPELSGRENIFLNGALLGFSKHEMDEKFNRIVEFAELENFIDAPMRTYSSGMWARLGFAVATDSQPEILLVDEVLAVGDEQFQLKCFERIESFQKEGTTIIIVAHNMSTISQKCDRVCWIDHGEAKYVGSPDEAIQKYRLSQ